MMLRPTMSKKKIQLKANAHIPCLRIWCGHCRTTVKTCEGKPLSQCSHIEKLQYRFVGVIPNTKERIVRSLGTDFSEAVKQAAILRQKLDAGEIEGRASKKDEHKPQQAPPKVQGKPELLMHVFGKFIATLNGEGVAPHLKLVRSKSHVNDVKNCFKQVLIALSEHGIDVNEFKLSDITDAAVGKIHDYLIAKGYSNTVYNRWFGHLTTFAGWAEREEYGNVKRFFERVPRKTVTPRPEIITKDEFEKLLSVISRENGVQSGIGKHNASRNNFRSFLIPAFRYAAITGRRLEEIITSRFSDLHLDDKGNPQIISFTDHKVNRILHVAPGQERKVHTPVTAEILSFLHEQGFAERKNSNDFILAPEITHNRVALMKLALTRGFSHFWKVAFPNDTREITFKILRKTYLTNLAIHMGRDVREISGHSSRQILNSYINDKQLALADKHKDFSVFGKTNELRTQRQSHNKEKGIER